MKRFIKEQDFLKENNWIHSWFLWFLIIYLISLILLAYDIPINGFILRSFWLIIFVCLKWSANCNVPW
jgi:hypothetical protein